MSVDSRHVAAAYHHEEAVPQEPPLRRTSRRLWTDIIPFLGAEQGKERAAGQVRGQDAEHVGSDDSPI